MLMMNWLTVIPTVMPNNFFQDPYLPWWLN
jgi:hypothetical protein